MIKSSLLNELFLAKIIKILLMAFLLNTVLIFVFYYGEDARSLLDSMVNFSMTIEQSNGGPRSQHPPQKPQALTPENGSAIPLPFAFTTSQFVNENNIAHLKSFWVFRRSDETFDQPVFQMESISPDGLNLTNFLMQPSEAFQLNQAYFWKVKYMNSQDIWSEFSDEKSFAIQEPPPQVIIGSGGGGGGGGGGTIYYTPPKPAPVPITQTPATRPMLESGQKKTTDKNPFVSPLKKTTKTLREKLEEKKELEEQKKLGKKLKKPSLNIKLNNKKIQKKKPVKVKIQNLTPKKSAKKKLKDVGVRIRIEKQNKEKILNYEEALRIKEESTKTIPIRESKKLDVGAYVAVVNYEEDGILYSFSESFEIIPSPPNSEFVPRILFWNEASLPFLLLGSTLVLYWKKKQKRKFRK